MLLMDGMILATDVTQHGDFLNQFQVHESYYVLLCYMLINYVMVQIETSQLAVLGCGFHNKHCE